MNDGVEFSMKSINNGDLEVTFRDTKQDNRIIVMQILISDIEKFKLMKGVDKGKKISELNKFWDVSQNYPKNGLMIYHIDDKANILWVRCNVSQESQ